ncbi:hypothetical protein KOI35_22325 [Actinoplanes bogorensis]|uniref:Uncharacterized protein n=1 Tax=Paractinoplanes bogorensis TaxID=1610840 RepID=A0ABS5YS19_9ACTN|nr:hypothetical protein [Actinoplanes bogorensis]MBU2666242.1 hypothetical protein [Actinoplanes bogorensis]
MSPERRRRIALDGGLVVGVAAVVFLSTRNFSAPYSNKTQSPTALMVTLVVLIGGLALGTVVRIASGRRDSFRQWIHRSMAGALLLTPAAMVLTRTYLAVGWDFSDCGTLLFPHRPPGADLVGFRTACDVAADKLTLRLLLWVGFGVLVAYGYGLWLKYRKRWARRRQAVRSATA